MKTGRPLLLVLVALAIVVGCGAPSGSWEEVPTDEMSSAQEAQMERARAARDSLMISLGYRLRDLVEEVGNANAISVCREDAPRIARQISERQDLSIGRTSFRLRNPDNAPPSWAAHHVGKKVDQQVCLAGDEGQLGVLLPVRLQSLCVPCHGPSGLIPPPVRDTLAVLYPDDKATGFRAGELRGWVWVEVPG